MRLEPSIPVIPRTANAPIDIGGQTRDTGTMVVLCVATGNRDAAIWTDPHAFDAGRFAVRDAPRLLSFGTGAHFCLGSSLARMTIDEALTGMAAQPLRLAIDPDDVEWKLVLGRSPVSLPVAAV
jgi:cytochrome P450